MAKTKSNAFGGRCACDLAFEGLSCRVYASFFGEWKSISQTYQDIYCEGTSKKPNTGRISLETQKLGQAGYLVSQNFGPGWKKWTATLLPLYVEAQKKGVEFSETERGVMEKITGCLGITTQEHGQFLKSTQSFGLSKEEATGKTDFTPTPWKIKSHLHAILELSIMLFGNKASSLPKGARQDFLKAIEKTMEKEPSKKKQQTEEELEPASSTALKLAIITRSQLLDGTAPKDLFAIKLARLLHEEQTAKEIEQQIYSAYQL